MLGVPGPGGGQLGDAAKQNKGELVGQISPTDGHWKLAVGGGHIILGVGQCTGFGVGLQCGPTSVHRFVGHCGVGQAGVGQCQFWTDGQWNALIVGQCHWCTVGQWKLCCDGQNGVGQSGRN
jgi:hypothetical protein